MQLYEHQKEFTEKILKSLNNNSRVCCQLATGGGKTVVFSNIAKNFNGRVLILVDSDELVKQTADTIKEANTFQAKNKIMPTDRVVVAMSDTIASRIKRGTCDISDFNLVIVDEAHEWTHNKLFEHLNPFCKILGFTATPVRTKRITFYDNRGDEWTREELMSDVYQDIVCGIGVDELIDEGFLVDEQLYVIKPKNIDKLKTDNSGEFTDASIDAVFNNEEFSIDVLKEYKEYCKGKKTMIFTANTKANIRMYNLFSEAGINCKMYDSVNKSEDKRSEVVEWFRTTPEAVLLNVNVFTKGFDVKDVEAIILARAIGSLSLFIQIAGRGARTATNIYKDRFIFIDGGGNSERFGMWSMKRDWSKIFWNGLRPPKKKREAIDEVKDCKECGYLMPKHLLICPNCGFEEVKKEQKIKNSEDSEVVLFKPILPNPKPIINYAKSQNEDKFFALKVLNNLILDLYIAYKVTAETAILGIKNGKFEKRMSEIYRPIFFAITFSDLPSESNRTYEYQLEILTNKIKKHYGI